MLDDACGQFFSLTHCPASSKNYPRDTAYSNQSNNDVDIETSGPALPSTCKNGNEFPPLRTQASYSHKPRVGILTRVSSD